MVGQGSQPTIDAGNWGTKSKLNLPRAKLHHLLALRTTHDDFAWYHRKFVHTEANWKCSCGRPKHRNILVPAS
ncbi:endonuclease exonuclease phosphatase protein [Rutstroemia sp. NJR-2017a BBW]|nr:endonuclease exonuclease phosphatase protein [Rutstroemia sp. NJR-2017a BBW]